MGGRGGLGGVAAPSRGFLVDDRTCAGVGSLAPERARNVSDCRADGVVPSDLDPDAGAIPAASSRWIGGFANVVAGLTGINGLVLIAGLLTGPITARALGVDGRGELAAITAVLTMGPWLLDIGLSQWLARERALGRPRSELLGAAVPVAFAFALIGAISAVPLSHALGGGRETVTTFLQIGLFLMPVSVLLHMLVGLAIGESRWTLFGVSRLTGSFLPAAAIIVLALLGDLSVASAAMSFLVGGLVANLLLLRTIRGAGRLRFDRQRSLAATSFGAKCWLTTVAGSANNRLDQVLMAGLVASRELGLYAVAVTLASVTYSLAVAVGGALFPRVAGGDSLLAARSCRITVVVVFACGAALAAASPLLIPFVFGSDFQAATTMAVVLLAAGVPLALGTVLGSALSAANDPAAAMRAEVVALGLTVPALVVLLPVYGGTGAALVSFGAYSVRAAMQLRSAARRFEIPAGQFIIPNAEDLAWLLTRTRELRLRLQPHHVSSRKP